MEKPFFLRNGSHDLFGVVHSPSSHSIRGYLLMCHPFGEEKLWSHRVFVNFAREAARRNFGVLRFDFMGHGDSSGQSEECSIDTYFSDIDCAIKTMRARNPNAIFRGMVGLRFGATLAALYVNSRALSVPLVLWEPIVDGHRYMQELLRINLSTQLATFGQISEDREHLIKQMSDGVHANVDGYLISGDFYQQCVDIRLQSENGGTHSTDCLVIQIAPSNKQKHREELHDLAASYPGGQFMKVREFPFWREIKPFCSNAHVLTSETLRWLEQEYYE